MISKIGFTICIVIMLITVPTASAGGNVVVLPFWLGESEPGWEWFSTAAGEETHYVLANSVLTDFELVPEEKVLEVVSPDGATNGKITPEDVNLILEKFGQPTLVVGQGKFSGESVILEMQIKSPLEKQPKRVAWVQGSIDSLPTLLHYVAKEAAKQLGGAYTGKPPLFAREKVPVNSTVLRLFFEVRWEVRKGNYDRAGELFDELFLKCPEHLGAQFIKSDMLIASNRQKEAIPVLLSLIENLPLLESRMQVSTELETVYGKTESGPEAVRALWKNAIDYAYKTMPKDAVEKAERDWLAAFNEAVGKDSGKLVLSGGIEAKRRPLSLWFYPVDLRSPFEKSDASRHVQLTGMAAMESAKAYAAERNYEEAVKTIEGFLSLYPAEYRLLRGVNAENQESYSYLLDILSLSFRETGYVPGIENGVVRLSPDSPAFKEEYDLKVRTKNVWLPGISTLIEETTTERRYVSKDPTKSVIVEDERDVYLFAAEKGSWIEKVEIEASGRGNARIRVWPFLGSGDLLSPDSSYLAEMSFPEAQAQTKRKTVLFPSGVGIFAVECACSGKLGPDAVLLPWSLKAGIVPAKEPGSMKITSEPSGVPIVIDGIQRGNTPLLLSSVVAGRRQVRANEPHFKYQEKVVEITPGEETALHFVLEPFAGVYEFADARRKECGWSDPVLLVPSARFGVGNPFSVVVGGNDEITLVWSSDNDLWAWRGTFAGDGQCVRLEAPIYSAGADHSPNLVICEGVGWCLSWLSNRGGGAVERRWVSTSADGAFWSDPVRNDRYFSPYRSIRFGDQTFKEGPTIVSSPAGGLVMYDGLREDRESSTPEAPVLRMAGRVSADGKEWDAVREILKTDIAPGGNGFPLLFGPYADRGRDEILLVYKSYASLTTGIYATRSPDGLSFDKPVLVYESKTHGINDIGDPRPLVLRDGTEVVYWRETQRIPQIPGSPIACVVKFAARPRGKDWSVVGDVPLMFAGSVGAVELIELSGGQAVLLYDDEGNLRATTNKSIRGILNTQ